MPHDIWFKMSFPSTLFSLYTKCYKEYLRNRLYNLFCVGTYIEFIFYLFICVAVAVYSSNNCNVTLLCKFCMYSLTQREIYIVMCGQQTARDFFFCSKIMYKKQCIEQN